TIVNAKRVSLFFFSSRRRHTSSLRDWSSDVCSSDLSHDVHIMRHAFEKAGFADVLRAVPSVEQAVAYMDGSATGPKGERHPLPRSEERRVGKECRSRRSRWQ